MDLWFVLLLLDLFTMFTDKHFPAKKKKKKKKQQKKKTNKKKKKQEKNKTTTVFVWISTANR